MATLKLLVVTMALTDIQIRNAKPQACYEPGLTPPYHQ